MTQGTRIIGLAMQSILFIALLVLTTNAYAKHSKALICSATSPYAGPEPRKAPATFPTNAIDRTKTMSAAIAEKLESKFREGMNFSKAGAGAIAIYREDIGYWSTSTGIAATGSKRFLLASITKLATAAVIFQLADEKKLSLDNTINQWFPDLPNSRVITIDHLLSHLSGLMGLTSGDAAQPPILARQFYWPSAEWTKLAGGNNFCPGARVEYNNQAFVLLARIAEQIDHMSFADLVDRRIAKPLGLKAFGILRVGGEAELVAAGEPTISFWYDMKGKKQSTSVLSWAEQDPGATAAFADVDDTLAFLNGWLTGKLFSNAQREVAFARMLPINTSISHGRGIMMWEVPDSLVPSVWLGHSGGMPGTSTIVIYDVIRNAWLAVAFNINGVNVNAIANEMLKQLDEAAPRRSSEDLSH